MLDATNKHTSSPGCYVLSSSFLQTYMLQSQNEFNARFDLWAVLSLNIYNTLYCYEGAQLSAAWGVVQV